MPLQKIERNLPPEKLPEMKHPRWMHTTMRFVETVVQSALREGSVRDRSFVLVALNPEVFRSMFDALAGTCLVDTAKELNGRPRNAAFMCQGIWYMPHPDVGVEDVRIDNLEQLKQAFMQVSQVVEDSRHTSESPVVVVVPEETYVLAEWYARWQGRSEWPLVRGKRVRSEERVPRVAQERVEIEQQCGAVVEPGEPVKPQPALPSPVHVVSSERMTGLVVRAELVAGMTERRVWDYIPGAKVVVDVVPPVEGVRSEPYIVVWCEQLLPGARPMLCFPSSREPAKVEEDMVRAVHTLACERGLELLKSRPAK